MTKWLSALAVALFLLPGVAKAAPIQVSIGTPILLADVLGVGETLQYDFEVTENLIIPEFAFSGTGTNGGTDLSNVRFGLVNPPSDAFDPIVVIANVAAGTGFIAGGAYTAGDMFSIFVTDGIEDPVTVTIAFSAIPVPAAGGLLLSALVVGGIASRTLRKSA